MKKLLYALAIACTFWSCSESETKSSAPADGYDVVILNGRVMDPETNFDAVRNVGIKDGIIVTITEEEISGKETIDAKGLVVAPGFVDTHIHGQSNHSYKMYVRDGMTTCLSLENGSLQVNEFYESREGKSLINHGTGASHEMARMEVMDGVEGREDTYIYINREKAEIDGHPSWYLDVPTNEQRQAVYNLLREGLDEGALMVTAMPGYYKNNTTTEEIWDIQKIAKEYDRGFGCHPRFGPFEKPPTQYPLGYKEVIANAAVLNQPILLSHNNNQGWAEVNEMVQMGRDNGMVIWTEAYPYAAGGPNAGNEIMDPEVLKAMDFVIEESVMDPATGKFLTEEELYEIRKNDPARNLVIFKGKEEWEAEWVATPGQTIVADAFSMFKPGSEELYDINAPFEVYVGHPRAAGSRGKALRLAREKNIDLMTVVSNAGAFPAKMLCESGVTQMCNRGKIQEGAIADITIFDPETVRDNSSFETGKNGLPTTGIPYVLVSGEVVVRDSKVDVNATPGKAIRYEVIEGREYVQYQEASIGSDPKMAYLDKTSNKDSENLISSLRHDCRYH